MLSPKDNLKTLVLGTRNPHHGATGEEDFFIADPAIIAETTTNNAFLLPAPKVPHLTHQHHHPIYFLMYPTTIPYSSYVTQFLFFPSL
jgi:hypothetical protein